MWKNIKRNENRARKKSGRARTNALSSMTPQGQAIWCAEHIENASGFNPEIIPSDVNTRKLEM